MLGANDPVSQFKFILRSSQRTWASSTPQKWTDNTVQRSPSNTQQVSCPIQINATSPEPPQRPSESDDQPNADKPPGPISDKMKRRHAPSEQRPNAKRLPRLRNLLPLGVLIPAHLSEYLPPAERRLDTARSRDILSRNLLFM